MNKQIYTITELSEELNQARQNVRRRLIKLDIKAINKDDREYKTDPLEYNYQALVNLAEDFGVLLRTSDSSTNEQASTTKEQASTTKEQVNEQAKIDIIELLKEQLDHEREQNKNLSKLNDNLLNQLDKNQTLLDQQQRLSLNDRNNIKMLESGLEEKEEKIEKETKWYHIFKRKNRRNCNEKI